MSAFVDSYCNKLELNPAKSDQEFLDLITAVSDKKTADKIVRIFDGRADGDPDQAIYKIMNQSLPMAKTFCGGFDGVYLKKLFQRLEKHKDSFGKNILDIGCNNGIITCFIAFLCPDSHVLGIDMLEDGLIVARQLADELHLNNVEFRCRDLRKISEKYDTVFMSKVLHECIDIDRINWYQDRNGILGQAISLFHPFVGKLFTYLNPGGTLISVERIPTQIQTYAYCLALNQSGIHPDMDTYGRIHFSTLGEKESFPFFISHQSGNDSSSAIRTIFVPILDAEEAGNS